MKILLLLILLIALIGFYYVHPFYKAVKLSKEIEADTIPFERHLAHPKMRILVAGDSTAVGTGAATSSESTAGRLGAYYPEAELTNLSENGLKLEGLEKKLQTLSGHFDLALIQIGANDTVQLTPMEKIEERINTVLRVTQPLATKVIVVTSGNIGLSPVFKWPVSMYLSSRAKEVRDIYMKAIAAYPNASYVDLYKEKGEDIFIKNVPKYYAKDLFHPSSDGYAVWFEGIEKKL